MSKYVPAKFAPVIYRSWANLFKNLTSDQKAEVLMAITLFPDYEPTIEIFAWDYIKAELEQEYEKFLAKKEQAKNARTLVDERRPTSTEGDERRPTSTLVDLVPVPVPVPVPKKEIDKEKTHPSPSAQDASVSTPPAKKAKRTSVCKPEDVPENLWCDWIALRKQKRLPLTAQALALVQSEAAKAGKTLADVLQICLQNSWAGFRASWLTNATTTQQSERPFYTPAHDWEAEREAAKENVVHSDALQAFLGRKA